MSYFFIDFNKKIVVVKEHDRRGRMVKLADTCASGAYDFGCEGSSPSSPIGKRSEHVKDIDSIAINGKAIRKKRLLYRE